MGSYNLYFSESESMNHQFSNALSTIFLRRLDIFSHFETYLLKKRHYVPFPGLNLTSCLAYIQASTYGVDLIQNVFDKAAGIFFAEPNLEQFEFISKTLKRR